jgi:pimeloyl-ACP methyl ester carboxylesterase
LNDYCRRLTDQINTKEKFILVGLSFGGMVAIEIAKLVNAEEVILLSSISTKNELPLYMKAIKAIQLHKIFPASLMKKCTLVIYWLFNARTQKEQALLRAFVREVSNNYLKWSLNAVLNWKNEERPKNLFHIHGDADRIFPFERTHADIIVKKGGHLMVYDHPAQISKILSERIHHAMD